jgi:hypothetical protein
MEPKLIVVQRSPVFQEIRRFIARPQETATFRYPEPDKSSLHISIAIVGFHFNIILNA